MAPDNGDETLQEQLRKLPGVDRVIETIGKPASPFVSNAARLAVESARSDIRSGEDAPDLESVVDVARRLLEAHERSLLRPVINATGVLIHTNLGRVPLGDAQRQAVDSISGGYSNLEYDLERGTRGNRYTHARAMLTTLLGGESALVVNNNAAAVLLVLSALCAGKEVIISRGELVEIGGEFRIPDVLRASGARLVEVGTTNRTHLSDYERAITPESAAILKVHQSNYRMIGFTAQADERDLARLARGRGLVLVYDIGSGLVGTPPNLPWTGLEPIVEDALGAGADLVTFSGDKLLGGPQAGIILGRADLIDKLSSHPLLRALRVDKMTLAALEATIDAYLTGRAKALPLWQMVLTPLEELHQRAAALADSIRASAGDEIKAEPKQVTAVTGGGSLPGAEMSSWAVAVAHAETRVADLHSRLRRGDPPVVARVDDDLLLLDLRTVPPAADKGLARSVVAALSLSPNN